MAKVALYQTISARRKTPTQRRCVIATQGGKKFALPFAPREFDLGGLSDRIESLDRPGRRPATVRTGDGLPTLSFDVVLAKRDLQSSVHDQIDQLLAVAASGERLSIAGLSKYEQGPWYMDNLTLKGSMRAEGTNNVTRATCQLSFVAAVDAVAKVGPVTGGAKKPAKKSKWTGGKKTPAKTPKKSKETTRYYRIKKGETLWLLASRYYGDPTKWPRIAKASKIKNVRRIPIGYRCTIPPK